MNTISDFYLVAKITSTHGRNGYVTVVSYSDFPERFFRLKEVYIDFFNNKKLFFIEDIKQQKDDFLLKFKNFNNDQEASFLIGKELFITKEELVSLPSGSFFIHDLIGSKVLRGEDEIGLIVDVLNYPANDVYVIETKDKNEILIPAVLEFIEYFDAQKKLLVLKPGAGIYEDDEN